MPNTPAKQPRQGADRTRNDLISEKKRQAYLSLLAKGFTAEQIACKLAEKGTRRYRKIKGQVLRVASEDEEYLASKASHFEGVLASQLPEMGEALARRARRGRVDAIKLALEVTGVHNPKVKHEHTGGVDIRLVMTRPPRQENETLADAAQALEDGTVVDATVVEDEAE